MDTWNEAKFEKKPKGTSGIVSLADGMPADSIRGDEAICVSKRWENLCACRDFRLLLEKADSDALDLFEKQVTEYLAMTELLESYLKEVPRIVCWYEGLIYTEMLLMETEDFL